LKRKEKEKKKKWFKFSQSPIGMFKDESSKCPFLKDRFVPLDPNLYPYYGWVADEKLKHSMIR
jgi:hypothetical protein